MMFTMDRVHGTGESGQSMRDFFAGEISQEDEAKKFELVALSEVKNGVCYGAYRFTNKFTGEEKVSAIVFVLENAAAGPQSGYSATTEYDGPREYECPREIYDLLTRFRHCEECAQAKTWRDRVEAWHRHSLNPPRAV